MFNQFIADLAEKILSSPGDFLLLVFFKGSLSLNILIAIGLQIIPPLYLSVSINFVTFPDPRIIFFCILIFFVFFLLVCILLLFVDSCCLVILSIIVFYCYFRTPFPTSLCSYLYWHNASLTGSFTQSKILSFLDVANIFREWGAGPLHTGDVLSVFFFIY